MGLRDNDTTWRRFADWCKRRPRLLRWADRLGRGAGRMRWIDGWAATPPRPAPADLRPFLAARFGAISIGHATTLLRINGRTFLTDPVFSDRVGLSLFLVTAGPRRLLAPSIPLASLPRLDGILLSHAHFDHLDRPTLRQLPRSLPVVTARRTSDLVRDFGFRDVRELDWNESTTIGGVTIRAVACKHWSPRVFLDDYRGYNAYRLDDAHRSILFGGDTAWHEGFAAVGPVDLMLVGIGAYDPFIHAHATPEQAYQMAVLARAACVMPMHFGVFRLSREPMDEPLRRFIAAATPDGPRVVGARVGGSWTEPSD